MTSDPTRDYDRLAKEARARRSERALPLNDANAKAGGISKHTWQRVEKGLPIRETNYVKIDRLMHWAPGSCLAIIKGGDPVPAGDVQITRAEVDREARDVVQLALIATAKGTTAEEIRDMSERVVQELRERGLL